MKKLFLILFFSSIITILHAQTNCVQEDGMHTYYVKLSIDEISADFSVPDFIQHVVENENLSEDEENLLSNAITHVYKVFPSVNHHKTIVLNSTSNLYPILSNFDDSVTSVHCRATNCEVGENQFRYYVLLSADYLEHSFDKTDFVSFLVQNDDISEEEIDFFEENITDVEKFIQFDSQFTFFHRFVIVSASTELFDVFFNYTNSIEFHECGSACDIYPEDCLLGEETMGIAEQQSYEKAMVYPNPLTPQSVLHLPEGFEGQLRIYDLNGKILYNQNIGQQQVVSLQPISLSTGVYFLKIQDSTTKQTQSIKVVK